jgi:hypothetical protein
LNEASNTNRKSIEIQSNFQSLVSFMITQSNSLVIDPQQQQQQQDKQASSSSLNNKNYNNNNNNNNNNNKINLDSFVTSIGYVLNENNDCFNIKVNPSIADLKNLQFDTVCSGSNELVFKQEQKQQTNNNNNNNNDETFKKIISTDLNEDTDDSLVNCKNWYTNLKNAYKESEEKKSNSQLDYINWLTYLLGNQTFQSALWCGPYYECADNLNNNNIKKNSIMNEWILRYTLPLLDMNKNLIGSVSFKFKIGKLDLNQCESGGDPIVSNTHKCKPNSECVFSPSSKFQLGSYKCKCTNGFMNNGSFLIYNGIELETQYWLMKNNMNNTYQNNYDCLPCTPEKCCTSEYVSNSYYSKIDVNVIKDYESRMNLFWQCRSYNKTLRIIILTFQVISILSVLWLSIFIFYKRQNKVIKHSMWILCELTLFGAFLLYFTVSVSV